MLGCGGVLQYFIHELRLERTLLEDHGSRNSNYGTHVYKHLMVLK